MASNKFYQSLTLVGFIFAHQLLFERLFIRSIDSPGCYQIIHGTVYSKRCMHLRNPKYMHLNIICCVCCLLYNVYQYSILCVLCIEYTMHYPLTLHYFIHSASTCSWNLIVCNMHAMAFDEI